MINLVSLLTKPNEQSQRSRQISLRKVDQLTNQQSFQSDKDKSTVLPQICVKTAKSRSTYINDAEKRAKESQTLLATDPRAHIKLDGGYGDYSMRLFRVKDRRRWLRDIPTLFTAENRAAIISCFPNNTMNERLLQQLISRPRNLQQQPVIIEPAKVNTQELHQSARKNQIQEIEDNMNGYLIFRQHPAPPREFIGSHRSALEHTFGNPSQDKINTIEKRQSETTKMKTKGYMFKGFMKLRRV